MKHTHTTHTPPKTHHLFEKDSIFNFNKSARWTALFGMFALSFAPFAKAAESSAGSGEIAIYTEATGTDVIAPNGSTAAGFLTHDFDLNDREDVGSFTRSGADVSLNRAGHYLAIYNSRFDATLQVGAEERVEIQSYLTLQGNPVASGWSQGFIRRQQNQLETITAGMAIIEAAAADVLQLRSFRTDTTTIGSATRSPNATGLQLIKLDDVNMSYARLSLATTQAGPTTAAWVKVAYDTDDEVGSGFSHSTGDLTLTDAGKYLVIANTYIQGANNRTSLVNRLTLDGTPVPNSTTTVYTRGNNQSTQDGSASIGLILEATAGQVLSVEGSLDVNNTVSYVGGRCALTVVKLPSAAAGTVAADPEYVRLRHTAAQNVNAASDTALVFNTQDEIDGAAFAHTSSTSNVTVNVDGDYLFLSSVFDATDDIARAFYAQGWSVNGGAKSPIGQSGRYSRSTGGADQFGNTSGFIGSDLTAGDTVAMVSSALGNVGVNNADTIGLQGVRLDSLFTKSLFSVNASPSLVNVTEGGSDDTYDLSLGATPTGLVEVEVTSDADTVVSLDGVTFTPTVSLVFTDTTPQTVHVRAFDDALNEGPETAIISHAITSSLDLPNYPLSLPIDNVLANVGDNDVVPVVANDDVSEAGNPGDEDTVLSLVDNGGGGTTASLLDNDTDGSGNVVSSFDSLSTMGAAVTVNSDGTFTWDPSGSAALQALDDGDQVVDTFTYTAQDIDTNTDTATVSITVDGVNDAPVVVDDSGSGTDIAGPSFNVLANDSDVDDPITVVSLDGNPVGLGGLTILSGEEATITINPDGSFSYDPSTSADIGTLANGDSLIDTIAYEVSDGTVTVAGMITITSVGNLGASNDVGLVVANATETITILSNDDLLGAPGTATAGAAVEFLAANASNTSATWFNTGSTSGTTPSRPLQGGAASVLNLSPANVPAGITAVYEFSGANSGLSLIDAGDPNFGDTLDVNDATIELILRPADLVGDVPLWDTGGNGTGASLVLLDNQVVATVTGAGATAAQVVSQINGSVFTHVAMLIDTDPVAGVGTVELFINGVSVGSDTLTDLNSGLDVPLVDWSGTDDGGVGREIGTIGGAIAELGAFGTTPIISAEGGVYDGEVADFRIYGSLLTPVEITANVSAIFGAPSAPVVGDIVDLAGETTLVPGTTVVNLPSGATVKLEANGTLTYDPNGAFDDLALGLEATDTFTYTLAGSSFATATVTARITGTNTDPQVSIAADQSGVTEGSPAGLTITSASAVSGDVTVNLSYSGTAQDGLDFIGQASRTISNGTNSVDLDLTTIADALFEGGSETIIVSIDSISGPATLSPTTTAGTFLDDGDSAPVFTIAGGGAVTEGGTASFTVTASIASDVAATIDLGYTGTADGTDFSPVGQVTIQPSVLNEAIALLAFDDGIADSGETIIATISNPSLGSVGASDSATATISDGSGDIVFFADFEGVNPLDTPGGTLLNADAPSAANLGTAIGHWANIIAAASGGSAPGLVTESDDVRGDGLDRFLRQDRPATAAEGEVSAVFDGAIDISGANTGTISFDFGQLRTQNATLDKSTRIIGLDSAGIKSFELFVNADNLAPGGKSLYHVDSVGTLTQIGSFQSFPNTQDISGTGGISESAMSNVRLGLSSTGYTVAIDVPTVVGGVATPPMDGVPDVVTSELAYAGSATLVTKILFQISGSTDIAVSGGIHLDNVSAAGISISTQEAWRLVYYGSTANSGPGADLAIAVNGQTNLMNYALGLDPTVPAGVLAVDAGSGTILSLGPPSIWVDPVTGQIYLRHTRRADFVEAGLTITDEFSFNMSDPFEASADPPEVIATGTSGGVSIEAVQTEFPLALPISGRKGRYGRVSASVGP